MRTGPVALLTALVLAAGCGDDPPDPADPADPAASSAPEPTASTSPPASPSPTPTTDPETGATAIDTGGTQVVGLAVSDGSVWAVSYDTATMARIDPDTNAVVATLDVLGGATAAALPSGLWVAAYGNPGSVLRIDTGTATIAESVQVGDLCCDLTEGAGLVWSLDRGGRVLGVDPAAGDVAVTFPVPLDLNAHNNVVFAGGYVWVSSDTTPLFRIDPGTGERTAHDVGGGVPFLARDGLLWGASPTQLWAVDPASGEVAQRVPVPDSEEVMALALDGRTAWVGMRHPGRVGAVVELDLSSGTALREVPVDIPARIELAFGSAWVSDSGSSMVYRVDR